MKRGSWLCPTELDRARVVDAHDRVRTIRFVGSGAVGLALALAAPWVGRWPLALFALALLNFVVVELRIRKSAHPERVSACAIVITMLLIGVGVGLSGGPRSVALPWIVLPTAMVAARFRPRVVIAALGLTIAIALAATFASHPRWTVEDPAPLVATLALLAGIVSIVWALQAAELHHRGEAMIDPLTGLFNRNALIPRFAELSHQARLTQQPVCLLLCDLDNFKTINDEHGHDRGDAALHDMAYELRKRLHSFDLVYRLGGEEFLVVLPGLDVDAGRDVAERLRSAVEDARPAGVAVTVSIGVSAASGERVEYESLFKAADEALYRAKRGGRNRVTTAGAETPGDAGQPHREPHEGVAGEERVRGQRRVASERRDAA
ncbi:MAG TPA: diguanylate cyclase [Solirubrobacteraceae bacterium]|jgi:diguanylate cyclase (GGDEF)-like protein|nr:diguanylate cyclase [Solirubrobacteraceae bacterium]